ncbi:hypothetical protein ES332_A01G251500v1 [Gossypium tomentosum]|uniref:Sulfotransferase n=1 Tax=Gossypium tomentosum TaxID=34277 RepID=A0A5D2RVZ5_GOSTO|nr:hypothetical protein ES332_A01G251500v1 [Gossypium tomentosum]
MNMTSFKEIISTLPRRKSWNDSNDFFLYQGFWCYSFFIEGVMSAQQNFQSQPSDIVICSAPKTGTTWLKSLTFAIVTRTTFDGSTNPLLANLSHDCVPFLEVDLAQSSTNRDPKNPLLATHVPYSSLPRSIIDSSCKIVYICRNPKDSFVSFYHFIARRLASKDMKPLALEEAFELYCQGVSNYGPYWDHVLGFWKASLDRPNKILFLKYEEMIEDTVLYVKKLADFIGYPFSSEEIKKGSVDKIVSMCSFENLSNLEVNKSGKHREGTPGVIENKIYFRKGKVGDWENYLTPEMAARLDSITLQKLNGSGLTL